MFELKDRNFETEGMWKQLNAFYNHLPKSNVLLRPRRTQKAQKISTEHRFGLFAVSFLGQTEINKMNENKKA